MRQKFSKKISILHRLFLLFLILLLPLFIFRESRLILSKKEGTIPVINEYYHHHVKEKNDKTFVFIIPAYNNAEAVEKLLGSILEQSYSDYRVIYLDGGSTDGSYEMALDYLKWHDPLHRVKVIRKKSKANLPESYYHAVHSCDDDEVVVHLDGKDWLSQPEVLTKLNHMYENPETWLTYAQYLEYPSFQKGYQRILPRKTLYRKKIHRAPWVISPFKTYYAGLFKRIEIEESFYQGTFLSLESEKALLLPMAKEARWHVRFVPEVLYVHHKANANRSKLHIASYSEHFASSLTQARSVAKTPTEMWELNANQADLVVISVNRPRQLNICLDSISRHVKGMHKLYVIYYADEEYQKKYDEVQRKFPLVRFIEEPLSPQHGLKETLMKRLSNQAPFIGLMSDQIIVKSNIELNECIEAMSQTEAYAFYFHLGREKQSRPISAYFERGICIWDIEEGKGAWKHPDGLNMALYRKEDLKKDLNKMHFDNVQGLIDAWLKLSYGHRLGLYYAQPKIFCMPCHQ